MRDDAARILGEILYSLARKESLLDEIFNNEREKIALIRRNKLDKLEDILTRDEHLMAEIDASDYEVSRLADDFARIAGIERDRVFDFISENSEDTGKKIDASRKKISMRIREAVGLRDEFCQKLAHSLGETAGDIRDLRKILIFKYPRK